ncbi:MarR family winged helix-turn-helix transcriptional regulator [Agromyces sp. SYSU T0242]|uniref:MarR family winged helix-turn-helix transcriptional regulator n=1 Tax=Agromyces litoreus TaxID=3158561 RepID=UPI003393140C
MTADPAVDEAIALVEEQFGVMFNRIRTVWKQSAEQVHPDLQPAGYKLLSAIVRLGPTNAHVLAEHLDMDKSVVSRQVRALEEIGLVTSRPDERDGRLRLLAATAEAEERIRAVREANQSRLRAALRDHPADDLRRFAELLRVVAEA